MIELREATHADRDAILALRARCFPDDDPEKRDPRFWEWEYRGGRMFVAEAEGRVVGHLGLMAQTYVIDGRATPSMLAVDAMTDPAFRGQKLFGRVAKFAAEKLDVPFIGAWQIRRAVLGGVMWAGWEACGGARILIRPLRVQARQSCLAGQTELSVLHEIAEQFFTGTNHVQRSESYLRWRYFENPFWKYDIAMNDNAWIATRRLTLRGWDTQAIVDIAWRPGRAWDAAALLASRATLHAALVTRHHPAYWWLIRRGFLPGPHRFRFLVNGPKRDFALAWGDTDHL
jgi:Acetyltransferase (GNAT) domain